MGTPEETMKEVTTPGNRSREEAPRMWIMSWRKGGSEGSLPAHSACSSCPCNLIKFMYYHPAPRKSGPQAWGP